jgi:hypothetical protein
VLGVIVVRFLVLATPLNAVEGAQYLYVLALAAIVAWTAWHVRRLRGIWLISLGALLNLIVILANGGRMPVAPELAGSMGGRATVGQYTVMGSHTNLNFLGDWIRLGPAPEAYSLGDVLIGVGLAIVVFLAIRNPSAYEGVSPP